MSKNEDLESKVIPKDVFLDFEGVILILQKRGVVKNLGAVSKEFGYTPMGMRKIRKKAPAILSVLNHFLKENDLKFEDLVKECETKK